MRYGTLICDLEHNQPIDLLPDRSVETVEAWLKQHPSVRVVSRDGSSEYASAIRKGAPQAQQVSDRWHILKNFAACVSARLTKTLAQLRRAQDHHPPQTQAIQQVQQARQAERMTRYEQALAWQRQGMKSGEIARTLSMSQRTLQRWMATATIPYSRRKSPRPRLIDPYKNYLLKRWLQGCHGGAQLAKELRARGYTGSDHGIYRYLETLKAVAPVPSRGNRASKRAKANLPGPCDALAITSHLALFPLGSRQKARRTGNAPPTQTSKPPDRSPLSVGGRLSAHGPPAHGRPARRVAQQSKRESSPSLSPICDRSTKSQRGRSRRINASVEYRSIGRADQSRYPLIKRSMYETPCAGSAPLPMRL
jgi:DNA-binding transcriptional regulator YiaG